MLLLILSCVIEVLSLAHKFNQDVVIYFNITGLQSFSDYLFSVSLSISCSDILMQPSSLQKAGVLYFLFVSFLPLAIRLHISSSSVFQWFQTQSSLSLVLPVFPPLIVPLLSGAFGKGRTNSGVGTAGLWQYPSVVTTLSEGPTTSEVV